MPLLVLLSCLAWVVAPAAAEEVVPARRAREFADQWITVEGKVMATRREGRNTFLTIGPPAQPELTVVVRPPLLSDFPDQPDRFYDGKTVRASGKIYLFRGHPEMIVTDSNLIEVVGAEIAAAEEQKEKGVELATAEIRQEAVEARAKIPDAPVHEASVETGEAEPAELEIEAVPVPAAEPLVETVEPEPRVLERQAAAEPVPESVVETIEVEEEAPGIREVGEPEPVAKKEEEHASLLPTTPAPAPELVTRQERAPVDVRLSDAETDQVAQASNACGEAQVTWRRAVRSLIPHLRAYAACLEQGSFGCDHEGESVEQGMLSVQHARERIGTSCD